MNTSRVCNCSDIYESTLDSRKLDFNCKFQCLIQEYSPHICTESRSMKVLNHNFHGADVPGSNSHVEAGFVVVVKELIVRAGRNKDWNQIVVTSFASSVESNLAKFVNGVDVDIPVKQHLSEMLTAIAAALMQASLPEGIDHTRICTLFKQSLNRIRRSTSNSIMEGCFPAIILCINLCPSIKQSSYGRLVIGGCSVV